MGLEIHHPIMSTLGEPGVRLDIYVYILNGGLTFPLYTSEKSINWKMTFSFFVNCFNQIKRNTCNDYSFIIGNVQDSYFKRGKFI